MRSSETYFVILNANTQALPRCRKSIKLFSPFDSRPLTIKSRIQCTAVCAGKCPLFLCRSKTSLMRIESSPMCLLPFLCFGGSELNCLFRDVIFCHCLSRGACAREHGPREVECSDRWRIATSSIHKNINLLVVGFDAHAFCRINIIPRNAFRVRGIAQRLTAVTYYFT